LTPATGVFFVLKSGVLHATIVYTMVVSLLTIAFVFLMALLFTYAYGGLKAAPWVPMRSRDLTRLDRLIPLKSTDRVYDLGCGDARTLAHSLEKGAHSATGYEVSLIPYILAQRHKRLHGKKLRLLFRDFWKEDLSDATVIFIFLSYKGSRSLGKSL
jgi:SAM-dependent methyltransferase